jgi:F-type H+-transporting ATPase subunit b
MEGGLPQLNPDWFSSQLFWFGATFIILYVTVSRYLTPRIHELLETRQERINHDLDWAASLKTEAEEARDNYESALADARKQAQTLLSSASEQIRKTADQRGHEIDQELRANLEEAEKDIQASVTEAYENLAPTVSDVASLVVERMLNEKPDAKRFAAILEKIQKESSL